MEADGVVWGCAVELSLKKLLCWGLTEPFAVTIVGVD